MNTGRLPSPDEGAASQNCDGYRWPECLPRFPNGAWESGGPRSLAGKSPAHDDRRGVVVQPGRDGVVLQRGEEGGDLFRTGR